MDILADSSVRFDKIIARVAANCFRVRHQAKKYQAPSSEDRPSIACWDGEPAVKLWMAIVQSQEAKERVLGTALYYVTIA